MVIDLQKLKEENKKLKLKKSKKDIKSLLKKKISNEEILKRNKMSVHIQEREIPSVLNDEQRFFKGEFNKEKKRLFLS